MEEQTRVEKRDNARPSGLEGLIMIDGSNAAIHETVPAVVTVAEAANLMKVHEQSVRNFIRDGRLKAI